MLCVSFQEKYCHKVWSLSTSIMDPYSPNQPKEKIQISQRKRSELAKGKGQERSKLAKEKGQERSELANKKKVRIDQWSGSEVTSGQGPNKLRSELTRAKLAKVRIDHILSKTVHLIISGVNETFSMFIL